MGSFDEELWQMTPLRAAWKETKACDIIAQDTFSGASQHSSVLFLRWAKNSKGDLRGCPNWDWKISKQSLSISENCKNTTHHTAWQSSCADTSPKLEVSTPCLKTKRTREDAIPKRQMTFFNPHFPSQSMNCSGHDNRGCYKDRLPEKCRTVEFV